jgi:hypothetical protein
MFSAEINHARRFAFARDTFAFANQLLCEYRFDPAGGRPVMVTRQPRPDYALRCFVLVRAARQFFYHAEFQPEEPPLSETEYRRRIRLVVRRNPRRPCAPGRRVGFPGFAGLRAFSLAWEPLLKSLCGGAWRSYVLRSHWRMVLPITRRQQERTALGLTARFAQGVLPIVHLVRFPQLTINHGLLLVSATADADGVCFEAYDPNCAERPVTLSYHRATREFHLPPNRYWAGGRVEVIEIYRSWWF